MKRLIKICIVILIGFISMRASCGKPKPVTINVTQAMEITDNVYYHNMSITYNGSDYVTINGGNTEYCKANTYDSDGNFNDSYDVKLDGRAIFYNPDDDQLYVKVYGNDLYSISLEDEDSYLEHESLFEGENSSPAMSSDGKYFYELINNKVNVIDISKAKVVKSFKVKTYSEDNTGYNTSIAASEKYLFVWGSDSEIIVYDLHGKYVTTFSLPESGFGYSLSYCNGMLWCATDADGGQDGADGTWYGYTLEGLE